MTFRSFLFLIASFIFIIQPAAASEPIGTVVEIEGAATRVSLEGRAAAPLNISDNIYLNDTIQTFNHSRILVMLEDDTEITLGENSSLALDEYLYDPKTPDDAKGEFSVLKGSFLFVSGLISKNPTPDVKVKTSYGTIGLRGTTVWGGEMDGEYGVLVQDGEVEVANREGRTLVGKGLGTFIRSGEGPRQPKAWAEAKTNRAVSMIALKRAGLVQKRIAARKAANDAQRKKIHIQPRPLLQRPLTQPLENNAVPQERKIENLNRKKEILGGKKLRPRIMRPSQGND